MMRVGYVLVLCWLLSALLGFGAPFLGLHALTAGRAGPLPFRLEAISVPAFVLSMAPWGFGYYWYRRGDGLQAALRLDPVPNTPRWLARIALIWPVWCMAVCAVWISMARFSA